MAQVINVRLNKGEAPSLGFRLQGGKDFGTPLIIQKVNIGSPAEKAGLFAGDAVIKINNTDVFNLRHKDAQDVIIRAGPAFEISVQRGGSTWKPSVTPVSATLPKPQPASNSYSPVTQTSLAARPQQPIDSIGTGHNVSAKPFTVQLNGVNGGPKLVNKQYNTPVGLYSEQSIAETLSAQTEVLAPGVLGVNFKKNEKNYDASNSAVFRMVQEADKEPRDAEPEPDSGVVTAPLQGAFGLRHVTAPETKPTPSTPQLPPGQNICAECERLVTGVFVRIKDKNLHVECFKCATCGTSLKNVGYYNINNKLYCDIHAKLAARSNPPAANLVPVTVPPGGRAPAGTISAALSGHHPLPASAAPLSPNYSAQPFQLDVTNQVPQTELEATPVTEPVENQNSVTKEALTEPEPQNSLTKQSVPINGTKLENRSGPLPFSTYLSKATPNFSSPRPFSSVSAPLSPPASQGYSTLPRAAPPSAPFSSPAPSIPSSEKGRSLQNIIWPPPPDPENSEIPTATPLYFPPSTHIRVPTPTFRPIPPPPPPKPATPRDWRKKTVTEQKETKEETVHTETTVTKEMTREETEEEVIKPSMDPRMSLCSSEVVSIVDRKVAVETIESAAETQMLIESVMKQRPKSPPPINQDIQPKVEVQTQPFHPMSGVLTNQQEPRVVTRVCVCTNSCCNAETGQLCESCPMRDLKRPTDYQIQQKPQIQPVQNSVPKRYGSPIITGVSVTINNPGKIKETKNPFSQIPMKRTTTALGSALVTAPKEPFHSMTSQLTTDPVALPEETTPYLPPERPYVPVEKKEKPKPPPQPPQPDTPFIQALRIAPERPFTPTNIPVPVYKKPKETKKSTDDPLLKDLPKPTQWMSMVSALTTAPDRSYSPFVAEVSSTTKQTTHCTEMQMDEITKIKQTQQQILQRSYHNETALPKPFVGTTTTPVKLEKFEPVNDDKVTPQMHFPPISDELRSSYEYHADYSDIKSEISSQIVEQAHLEETSEVCTKKKQEETVTQCSSCRKAMTEKKEERKIEKQTEEIILKKPMELTGYLHKPEYLPQYQVSLSYDETIQLPHHKDIKKLLKADQSKQDNTRTTSKPIPTYYPPRHMTEPQSMPTPQTATSQQVTNQPVTNHHAVTQPAITKPVTTIQPGAKTPNNIPHMSFQTINDEQPQRTSFSPRPGSLTPSMINKPAPTLPYYQENLIYTPQDIPEVNVFDPKSPAISRSPSPCPGRDRSPSPFGRMSPRAKSPAAGPPPNPLKQDVIPKFTKEDRLRDEAKKNIGHFIPQHMQRLDVKNSSTSVTLELPTQGSYMSSESSERRQQGGVTEDICCKKSAFQTQSGYQTQSNNYEKTSCGAAMQECKKSEQVCQRNQECKISQQTCQKSQECKMSQQTCQRNQEQMCQRNQVQSNHSMQQSTQRSSQQTMMQQSSMQQSSHQTMQHSSHQSIQQSQHGGKHQEHPFKQVKNPEVEPPGVVGMRVTNPQPLHSPFLAKTQPQPPQPAPPPPPKRTSIPVTPISSYSAKPNLSKPVNPGVSSNQPTIPQPNAGAGGGRQSGAVGFSPKRGKGVLNIGGMMGSRVPVCGHCHGQIRGPFISALGKIWCPDHFTCNTQSCRRPLQDLGFVEDQNGLFCEYCFEQYLAPPCSKCGSKVKGDCLKAIGKNFHPECFNCSHCGKLFGNSPFFLEDGQPYCENDWNELFTTKCFACGFPVEAGDRWLEALNNNYHSQCFNCTSCKKNLEGQKFFAKGGRPYCNNHAR